MPLSTERRAARVVVTLAGFTMLLALMLAAGWTWTAVDASRRLDDLVDTNRAQSRRAAYDRTRAEEDRRAAEQRAAEIGTRLGEVEQSAATERAELLFVLEALRMQLTGLGVEPVVPSFPTAAPAPGPGSSSAPVPAPPAPSGEAEPAPSSPSPAPPPATNRGGNTPPGQQDRDCTIDVLGLCLL